jgi:hypothetical protein
MRSISKIPRAALLAASILLSGAQAADQPKPLDEGRLDPAWFGPGIEFRTTSSIDYVWAKQGFSCKGKALRIEAWPEPVFTGKERRGRDAAQAFQLAEEMPMRLRNGLRQALQGHSEVVSDAGDMILSGRLVDYVAKGTMGTSQPQATWDMKITDAQTGELLVALHHRRLSSVSTVAERIDMWIEEFGKALREDLVIASKGKPAKN